MNHQQPQYRDYCPDCRVYYNGEHKCRERLQTECDVCGMKIYYFSDMNAYIAIAAHKQGGNCIHKAHDMVNQPPHYVGEIECIDAMVSAFGLEAVKTYARIAAFKYLWRAGKKDAMAQELGKAVWYLRFANGDDPRKS